jgi:hypothetical protein
MQPEFPDDEGNPAPPGEDPQAAWPAGGTRAGNGARWRLGVVLAALVVGLAGLAVSAAGAAGQLLPRKFSLAQQQQIIGWQTARRWRTWPAGQIFPAAVTYQLPGYSLASGAGLTLTARRMGIAPQATCRSGTDPAAARVLARTGCAAVLRATYADSTGSMIVTVAVAVLPSATVAGAAVSQLSHGRLGSGVRAVPFPGTLASAFGSRERQLSYAVNSGPYLVMWTAGFADGRPRVPLASDDYTAQEMTSVADGVADAVVLPLGALPATPHCPGAPGC